MPEAENPGKRVPGEGERLQQCDARCMRHKVQDRLPPYGRQHPTLRQERQLVRQRAAVPAENMPGFTRTHARPREMRA